MRYKGIGAVVLLLLCGPLLAVGKASDLHKLLEDEWQRNLQESPVFASMLGDRRYNREWSDLSLAAFDRSHAADKLALQRLQAIDFGGLSDADQLNYDLFQRQLKGNIDGYRFGWHLIPLNQRGGIQSEDDTANQLRFANRADYDDWLARLRKIGDRMEQVIALMREGIERGVVPPKVITLRIPGQVDKQIVASAELSPFFRIFTTFPKSIAETEAQEIQNSARKVIDETVIPAYRQLATFLRDTYLPACRDTFGIYDLPNGYAFYEYLAGQFTTTDLTPDQIHQIGLNEVQRIRSEMEGVIEKVGFTGSFEEFLHFLRTDPQFYYDDPEDLLNGYLAISKRLDPTLVSLFGRLPRMPYGVKPIPDNIAPDTTTAYYNPPAADGSRPGFYFVNLYRPETRPKYEMEVLSVHEAVPGHHLQIALAMEAETLPPFRRFGTFTAFVEGWGLYSESLGDEMGLYQDPYSKFGQLTYDMWRAVRLVVDTGLHYKKWDRQRAIDFFKANAAKSEHDIVNEIDRYLVMPGQALAYKIGQMKIKELRTRAEQSLGEGFDIRAFHDELLSRGAIPLDVLEAKINAWIADLAGQP